MKPVQYRIARCVLITASGLGKRSWDIAAREVLRLVTRHMGDVERLS